MGTGGPTLQSPGPPSSLPFPTYHDHHMVLPSSKAALFPAPLPLPCRLGGLALTPSPSHLQLVTIPRKGSLSGPAEAADHQHTGTILIFH